MSPASPWGAGFHSDHSPSALHSRAQDPRGGGDGQLPPTRGLLTGTTGMKHTPSGPGRQPELLGEASREPSLHKAVWSPLGQRLTTEPSSQADLERADLGVSPSGGK